MPDAPVVRMPLRVRYHECDPQGIVFNAHYLAYADMASFACIDALAGSYAAVRDSGVDLVVAESNVRYLAPCRFGDELLVDTYVQRIGNTSLVLRFDIRNGAAPAAVVTNRYVWLDARTMQPVAPPQRLRDAFAANAPER